MAPRFPLYIDLYDNNCVIFGGGNQAAERAEVLLKFGAKVTVISPTICPKLKKLDEAGLIRYLPRRYYRGDCSSGYLCVAATNDEAVNISISDECKAKLIHVNVTNPSEFGTFMFPAVISKNDVTVSVVSDSDPEQAEIICGKLAKTFDSIIKD
ncbi:MAG: bifunctional precorrin-2 dehydrogenase/sirohydrochlorin ferrochelatase [Oscillospiraceae bacterium]|nr:bifunctional precorrin-2 dehydrogenase/sirohydrochlorin ferrochelatase [Oscillospiraceae bacterium]